MCTLFFAFYVLLPDSKNELNKAMSLSSSVFGVPAEEWVEESGPTGRPSVSLFALGLTHEVPWNP